MHAGSDHLLPWNCSCKISVKCIHSFNIHSIFTEGLIRASQRLSPGSSVVTKQKPSLPHGVFGALFGFWGGLFRGCPSLRLKDWQVQLQRAWWALQTWSCRLWVSLFVWPVWIWGNCCFCALINGSLIQERLFVSANESWYHFNNNAHLN